MALTTSDIHAAADRIAEGGQNPTLATVRAALGGGSFTTISEAMKDWKAARAAARQPASRETAPQAVLDRAGGLAAEIWAIAMATANDRLSGERESLEAGRREAEQGRQEAAGLADQLAVELDAALAKIEQQAEALRQAERQMAAMAALLERERERAEEAQARAEQALVEAARLSGRLEALQSADPAV